MQRRGNMKLFGFRWLAVSSLLLIALAARAETRPLYGGTLHVSIREAPTSLDPADVTQPDSFALRNITSLIFETLVTTDDVSRVRSGLAESWQPMDGAQQRWQFRLRASVNFHDGAALTPEQAAASLRIANPSWKITSNADSVVVECDAPCPRLPQELSLPRDAIVKKSGDGKLIGTGPFQIVDWQPGKKLVLGAEENYWAGRPFLDGIEIEFGRSFHEQLISLEMGKADLIEISAEQLHRISMASDRLSSSEPMELVALVFGRDAQSLQQKLLRQALALCVERASIASVILQGTGQPAASILPDWISGYGFVFSTETNLTRARRLRADAGNAPPWTISYDASDPLSALLAERIALNAKDAGLQLQLARTSTADLRIARMPLPPDPMAALSLAAASAGMTTAQINSDSAEDLYAAEREMLATQRLIPLFHLPVLYGVSPALRDWAPRPDGMWNLPDVWLDRATTGSDHP